MAATKLKLIIFANTSWHVLNFRLPLIKELQKHGVSVTVVAPRDESTHAIADAGVRYQHMTVGRKTLNPLRDLLLVFRVYRLYRRESPDIVFHNTIKPVIYGSIAAHWAGVKNIVDMIPGLGYIFTGNQMAQRILRPLVKFMYRLALKRSHAVIFQNPDDSSYFREHNIVEPEKSRVIFGSGVDIDHFFFVEPDEEKTGCTFLLFGRMLWDKGVGEFVSAARLVKRRYPDTRFVLLGIIDKDNPSHIPERVIRTWAEAGDIEYAGSAKDVREVLSGTDVVVLPSYYREGVPKSLLEAAAMGKPVITTDMPGCREAVVNNKTGLLVTAKDVDGLVNAMFRMIADRKMRAQMGREGRRFVAESFDVRNVNRQILETLKIRSLAD